MDTIEDWTVGSRHPTRVADRHPRLIWAVNHKTLLAAEVPILRSLGYSVFIPKTVPNDVAHRSAVVEYSYDADLEIPDDALEILNSHHFYERNWNPTLALILNRYFDVLVVAVTAYISPVSEAVQKFDGAVVARAFGRESPERFTSFFVSPETGMLLDRVEAMGNRFIFGQAFDNLAEIEDFRLACRAKTVTVAVPEFVWKRSGSWTGGDKRVLLLCPSIRDSRYYGTLYSDLRATFGALPHAIFGRQTIRPDDPSVLPYMKDDELLDLYGRVAVFAYPSVEPRHVHYSPIEAMILGTPVLYRSGGILDRLAGERLPGCCDSKQEMLQKTRQLLAADTQLQAAIRQSQEKVIGKFSTDLVKAEWSQALAECCSALPDMSVRSL